MPATRILHRGGNVRDLLPAARHPAVDAIEADIWVRSRTIVVHHDRPLGPLPFTISRRGIHRRPSEPVDLGELLDAVGDHTHIVLDLRSWFADPAPELARILGPLDRRDHIAVTCESWPIADRLRAWLPDMRVAYSVRSEQQLRRFIHQRSAGTMPLMPVTVRHSLLHGPGEVTSLRRYAGRVGAWTVDDIDRAIELVGWGVDEITSNRLIVLNSI